MNCLKVSNTVPETEVRSELLSDAILKLESLRKGHFYCEDTWYSCPKHEEGCANDDAPVGVCDCGADKQNETIEEITKLLLQVKNI